MSISDGQSNNQLSGRSVDWHSFRDTIRDLIERIRNDTGNVSTEDFGYERVRHEIIEFATSQLEFFDSVIHAKRAQNIAFPWTTVKLWNTEVSQALSGSANSVESLRPLVSWARGSMVRTLEPHDYAELRDLSSDLEDKRREQFNKSTELQRVFTIELKEEKADEDRKAKLKELDDAIFKLKNIDSSATEAKVLLEKLPALEERLEAASETFQAINQQHSDLNNKEATSTLITHFKQFQGKHVKLSWTFFALGLLAAIATICFTVTHALQVPTEDGGAASAFNVIAWKLAIAGGGTAISTYFLRLATYHRKLDVWSATMQVQLQTFAPYIQQIDNELSKDKLRIQFASRVFGDEPGNRANMPAESSTDLAVASQLSSIVADLAKAQGSTKG